MIILTIRTDKPEAEIGIYNVKGQSSHKLAYEKWETHRQLAETIHKKLAEILNKLSISLNDVEGIVCFKGPGSFTGLRIGLTVANALAYAQKVPIVASQDPDWIKTGIKDLLDGNPLSSGDKIAIPEYGAEPNITKQRK